MPEAPNDAPAAAPSSGTSAPDRVAEAPAPTQPAAEPVGQPVSEAPAAASAPKPGRRKAEPFLRRLRHLGHDETGFHAPNVQTWFKLGVVVIALVAILPFITPQWSGAAERVATLASLVFLVAAIGLWLGLGPRAFLVAATLVLVVYAATSWAVFAFPLDDFFVVGLLVSFIVFALAGFNLVFILEEILYDIDVRLQLRGPGWTTLPLALALALAIGLPLLEQRGAPGFPLLWTTSLVVATLLAGWWFIVVINRFEGSVVRRELHLFSIGALLASGVAEAVPYLDRLHDLPSLVPSLLVYLVLIASWVYASYTTLQRTHFLLRGDNAAPWVAILLGASLAVIAHAQVLFAQQGQQAIVDFADGRVAYLNAGIWIGLAFYVLRSVARILAFLRDTRGLGERGRRIAGHAARVAGTLEDGTERVLATAAESVLRGIDQALPGEQAPRNAPPGWELDDQHRVRRMP